MASNVSTRDGLGFEEIGQTGSQFADIWITGSFTAEDSIITHRNFSATGSLYAADAVVTNIYGTTGSVTTIRTTNANVVGSIIDTQGRYRSTLLGSATTNIWGGFIQAGSFDTNAGSQGVISFGVPYSSATSYYVAVTPTGSATGFEQSYVSGTRNASGVDFVGAASLRYDFVAVGN